MDALSALYAALMCGFMATTGVYWWLLREQERRNERLQRELDELRERDRRYVAANMRARTP